MTSTEKFALGAGRGIYRGTIHVGLINNMPDTALRATELQFARLLKEASGTLDVRLQLFSLHQIKRGEQVRSRMEGFYADANALPAAGIDALIVSNAEPNTDTAMNSSWRLMVCAVRNVDRAICTVQRTVLADHQRPQECVPAADEGDGRRWPRRTAGEFGTTIRQKVPK